REPLQEMFGVAAEAQGGVDVDRPLAVGTGRFDGGPEQFDSSLEQDRNVTELRRIRVVFAVRHVSSGILISGRSVRSVLVGTDSCRLVQTSRRRSRGMPI